MIIADTDVMIDYLAGHNPAAERVALELQIGFLATTAVTRFELLAGARQVRQETSVKDLLAALQTLPFDRAAADQAAIVRRKLQSEGINIGMGDSMIAGIVLENDGILLTRNLRHFERVEGLRLATLK